MGMVGENTFGGVERKSSAGFGKLSSLKTSIIVLFQFNMSTRTEKFQRKTRDSAKGKGDEPAAEDVEVIRFSLGEEAVSI
jgi:hypothetical protein